IRSHGQFFEVPARSRPCAPARVVRTADGWSAMRPDLRHFSRPPRPPAVGDIGQQLRDLPGIPAPYDWAEFRRRSRVRSVPKRQIVTWPHAAAAAGLTAFVAAMALLANRDHTQVDHHDAPVASVAPGNPAESHPSTDANKDPVEQAREAREWLAQ